MLRISSTQISAISGRKLSAGCKSPANILHSRISSFQRACASAWSFGYPSDILLIRGSSTPKFSLYAKPFSRILWDTAPFMERRSCVFISFSCSCNSIIRVAQGAKLSFNYSSKADWNSPCYNATSVRHSLRHKSLSHR